MKMGSKGLASRAVKHIIKKNVIKAKQSKVLRRCVVISYHEWMKSEELQKLTASEPLSLKEEYDMQISWREDEDKSMIGDCNIFIDKETETGEIEIMIAEESARGKRFGWEAVIMMLLYGINFIKLKTYEAKISLTNSISITMFKKLAFKEKCKSEVFQEVTFVKNVDDEWVSWLHEQFIYEIQRHD